MQKSSPALVLRPTTMQDLQRSGYPNCTLTYTCDVLQPFFFGNMNLEALIQDCLGL